MIDQLRQRLQALQKAPGIEGRPNALPFGIPAIDTMLGGGLARGALHEIAATGEAHLPVAAGFALAVARRAAPSPRLFWVSEDMAFAESGMPYGAGFDAFGLAPEQLVMVSAAHRRDLLWAMEEALRCGAITAVIGEMRAGAIDGVFGPVTEGVVRQYQTNAGLGATGVVDEQTWMAPAGAAGATLESLSGLIL